MPAWLVRRLGQTGFALLLVSFPVFMGVHAIGARCRCWSRPR